MSVSTTFKSWLQTGTIKKENTVEKQKILRSSVESKVENSEVSASISSCSRGASETTAPTGAKQ